MKSCELCKLQARTYCESDQASLCWDCDAKVHTANFLVARHSRTLLCHVCNSLTPWKASGEKLGHTFSVCRNCVDRHADRQESQGANDGEEEDEDDVEEEEMEDEDEEDAGEEEGENQVVPWSAITTTPPPSASSSSSSSEESSDSINVFSLKRIRESSSDLQLQEYIGGGGGGGGRELTGEAATVDSFSRLANRRIEPARSKPSSVFIAEPRKRSCNQREKGDFSDAKSSAFPSRPI